jgi:hypothetical protein
MRQLGLVLCVLAAAGCGVAYMQKVEPPRPLQPPANTGMVVFVRPSGWGGGAHADIIDEQGHFVGRSSGEAHFAAVVSPGPHMFTIWGENTDAVQVEVAPGHIYFVEVAITPGWMSAQFHLYGITPRTPTWAKRDDWVRNTHQMVADIAGGQSLFSGREGDVAERLRRAREHLMKYQGTAEQERHFITAADGI